MAKKQLAPAAGFLVFLAYATAVFFLPNDWWVMAAAMVNLVWMTYVLAVGGRVRLRKVWRGTVKVLPFVVFTMVFNWWLASWQTAVWIGIKLIIVCNATMIYAAGKTVTEVAEILAQLLAPLKYIGVKPDEVRILVSVALMMVPILGKELRELRRACRAKGMKWDLATLKMILAKTGWSLLRRVNQIEEGLMAKGLEID